MESHAVDDPLRTPTARPAVRRSTTDRHIGGVSSAVARYLGVSVTLARVGLVLSVLVGGLGLAVYAAVWLFVPDDVGRVLIHGQSSTSSESILAALLSGTSALLVTSWITRDGPSLLVAVLVTVGVFILSRRNEPSAGATPGDGTVPDAPPPDGPPPPPDGWSQEPPATSLAPVPPVPPSPVVAPEAPIDESLWQPAPAETGVLPLSEDRTVVLPRPESQLGSATALAPARPRAPKPMAFLGPLTVSIAVALAGSLMLLHAVGAIELRPSDIFIMVLAVIGLGLLVSTWFGRARGLIVLGLLLIPVVAVSAVADRVDLRGGIGDRTWTPATTSEVRAEYRLGAGAMQLDLTQLDAGTADRVRTEMSLGAGQLRLVVPQEWGLDIEAGVDLGTMWFYDHGVPVERGEMPPLGESSGGDAELQSDLIGSEDWFFPDRQDVSNDGRSSSGNIRSLRVEGAEGAPTLDVDLHVSAGVVEVFRVQS